MNADERGLRLVLMGLALGVCLLLGMCLPVPAEPCAPAESVEKVK